MCLGQTRGLVTNLRVTAPEKFPPSRRPQLSTPTTLPSCTDCIFRSKVIRLQLLSLSLSPSLPLSRSPPPCRSFLVTRFRLGRLFQPIPHPFVRPHHPFRPSILAQALGRRDFLNKNHPERQRRAFDTRHLQRITRTIPPGFRPQSLVHHGLERQRRFGGPFAALVARPSSTSAIRYTSHGSPRKPIPCLPADRTAVFPRIDLSEYIFLLHQGPRWNQGGECHGRSRRPGRQGLHKTWSTL